MEGQYCRLLFACQRRRGVGYKAGKSDLRLPHAGYRQAFVFAWIVHHLTLLVEDHRGACVRFLTSSTPLMAWIPTAPWQFRMDASEGSCFPNSLVFPA